jgi:hypothetical protein
MFARADAEKIKRLLDEPVGHFGILAQETGQRLLARTERAGFLSDEQARGQARFAPGRVRPCSSLFHEAKVARRPALCNPVNSLSRREDLSRKEFEGERNVLAAKNEALEKSSKDLNMANMKLAQQLEAAYQKVQDIAEKTVDGTSQSKALGDLQKLLVEQSRKGGEKA